MIKCFYIIVEEKMKNLFKIITIFLFCILSIHQTYADEFDEVEPKFSCIYEDFKLDPELNNSKLLQVDVYKDAVNLIVYRSPSQSSAFTIACYKKLLRGLTAPPEGEPLLQA